MRSLLPCLPPGSLVMLVCEVLPVKLLEIRRPVYLSKYRAQAPTSPRLWSTGERLPLEVLRTSQRRGPYPKPWRTGGISIGEAVQDWTGQWGLEDIMKIEWTGVRRRMTPRFLAFVIVGQ